MKRPGEKMKIKKIDEFKRALPLLERLETAGYEAYFVGGCVRDYLLERKIKDIDITTNATPQQVMDLFEKVIPVGIDHGTVIVRHSKTSYEVTTYRYKLEDGTFTYGKSLVTDLLYRDFTMNALAMDRFGHITDYYYGKKALQTKVIEAVEDPIGRFKEDPLRMVRAFRFVSQLGFSVESKTYAAITQLKSTLQEVAIERMQDEMTKLITNKHCLSALQKLNESGLINELPIFKTNRQYSDLILKVNKPFTSFAHMVAFLHYLDPEISINRWIDAWAGSNNEKKIANMLVEAIKTYKASGLTSWLVYQLDESLHKPFSQIIDTIYNKSISTKLLQNLTEELSIHSRKEINVNGHTLMKWFSHREPGQWIEEMLQAIEQAIVMNELENNEQKIKEWITCHPLAID